MAILEMILIIALGGWAGVLFYNANQQRQMQMVLDNAFYQLLEAQDSCISLIQLSATARVDPQMAQQYLERQVKMLGAVPEVDNDGNTFYRFPKLHLRPSSD
jgi:trans-aconitate methyltransferase